MPAPTALLVGYNGANNTGAEALLQADIADLRAPDDVVLGAVNAGHPGGMLPLTRDSAASFSDGRLPGNVYVADGSLFPQSLGNPPILTIVAMAKRIGRLLAGELPSGRRVAAACER